MLKGMLLLALLIWAISYSAEAYPVPPGGVPPDYKLSRIAPPELYQACLRLEQGDMREARRAFEESLQKDSRNYVAVYGWLQTITPEERKRLFNSFEEVLQRSPSAVNYFKAAILYWYRAYDTSDLTERGTLFLKCGEYARRAYELDPNPYTVILLSNCPVKEILTMLEKQMAAILGEKSMRVYLQAKQHRWQFNDFPPVGHLDLHSLQLLRAIIVLAYPKVLAEEGGWIVENKPDPKDPRRIQVLGRYTSHGTRIREYFRKWLNVIDQYRTSKIDQGTGRAQKR